MRDTKASLLWIVSILTELKIPFHITGGLAAKAYGAQRELQDIDIEIPEDKFELLTKFVSEHIEYGPAQFKSERWDLLLMTLNHHGQVIDLSGAYQTKIFDQSAHAWITLTTDFNSSVIKEILGIKLPVIARDELLKYKRQLSREVDISDIEEINGVSSTMDKDGNERCNNTGSGHD